MLDDDIIRIPASVQEMENRGLKSAAVLFLKGAVYQYIADNPDKDFCIRSLLGGHNKNWENTPLQYLYEYHLRNGKSENEAFNCSAIDAGWLLKEVLKGDSRYLFDNSKETFWARLYSVKKRLS